MLQNVEVVRDQSDVDVKRDLKSREGGKSGSERGI